MRLIYSVPESLQRQLKVNSEKLVTMTREFNRVAAELSLFSFYETTDTKLEPDGNGKDVVISTAPIVSIKSAVLELHHEVERPLDGTHADCAAFGRKNNYAQWSYLEKLERAVKKSLKLSKKFSKDDHTELGPKGEAKVEVHGFYETEDKATPSSGDKMPSIRLWTKKTPLKTFIGKGPAQTLNEFIQANTISRENEALPTNSESERLVMDGNMHNNGMKMDPAYILAKSSMAVVEAGTSTGLTRPSDRLQDALDSGLVSSGHPRQESLSPQESDSRQYGRRSSVEALQRHRSPSTTPLTRPTARNQKLTWVHLPFNNPTWCAVSDFLIQETLKSLTSF
jgi:hypothetical protein